MNDAQLRQEAADILAKLSGESLERAVTGLRRTTTPPAGTRDGDKALVSFDPDGTGYTAEELGDMLDARVERMERGEGVLTLEEFRAKRAARWA